MKTHYNLLTQIKVRICCVIALIAAAQSLYAWDYLTVYRNDGEEPLELFLADVDRMVCSKIGTDSLLYADWQVQEIWAPDTTYRIPLASIDSIRINTVDPEEANRNLVEASKGVSKIFFQTENISELASHLDEIRNMEKVEKAWVNGTSLLVKVKDWGVISFSFPISYETSSEKENAKSVHKDMKKAAINPSNTHSPLYDDQSLYDICIVNQAYNDENRSNVGRDARQMYLDFISCNLSVHPFNGKEFNLNFLKNDIYNYDIILMATHGVFDGQHHWIYTGQQFNVFKNFKEIDEWNVEVPDWVIDKKNSINNNLSPGCVSCGFIKEKRDGVDVLVLYAKVSESFFAKSDKRFKGDGRSLFFNTACQSMQENHSFPRALLRKGLGYYLGYTHTNSVGWPACKEFTELILNGYDYVDAKQNHMSFENKYEQVQVPNQQGEIETVVSELAGSQHYTLENVHTCIFKPETQEQRHGFNGELYGTIRQLNPSKTEFSYGFCISEDEEMKSAKVLDGISFNQCSYDSYRHTVDFRIELDDYIELDYEKLMGGKYYYCAYIFDGKNYCFGDIKQITTAEAEPYTVCDEANNTVTFYYDGIREVRGGREFRLDKPDLDYIYFEKVVFDSSFAKYYPEDTNSWFCFHGSENLKTFENIQYLNTSKVTNMNKMFRNCQSLTSLDLSSFDTSNVTDMNGMFYGCESLTSLDLNSFDTSNVTDMNFMFSFCSSLTSLDLSSFNTANVTTMLNMFWGCTSLTSLDFRNLYLNGNVGQGLFNNLNCLKHINLENANTVNATSMGAMFSDCTSLTNLDLSSFNTANVKYMNHMFNGCSSLTSLDLSNFDTSNARFKDKMFYNCSSLKTIYAGDWNWTYYNEDDMFENCSNLVGGKGTKIGWNIYGYDQEGRPLKYYCGDDRDAAHIDGGKDSPGLFTAK